MKFPQNFKKIFLGSTKPISVYYFTANLQSPVFLSAKEQLRDFHAVYPQETGAGGNMQRLQVKRKSSQQLQAAIPCGLERHVTVMVVVTVLATLAGTLYLAYTMVNSH